MYETGSWDGLERSRGAQIGIPEDAIPEMFFQSVDWAKRILAGEQMNEGGARRPGEPRANRLKRLFAACL